MSSQLHSCFSPAAQRLNLLPWEQQLALGTAALARLLLWPRKKLTNPVATVGGLRIMNSPGSLAPLMPRGPLALCPLWLPCSCSSCHPCDVLYPSLVQTLVIKVCGVILSVVGGLAVGKVMCTKRC